MVKTARKLKQKKTSRGEKGSPEVASEKTLNYVGNREGDKNMRKSYLRYRKELIGFSSMGLSKSYRTF